MTTIELRTSILADLEQMSVEMLENVSHYVKRLRRHARPVRQSAQTATKEKSDFTERYRQIEITPGVARLSTGNRWNVSDEELDRLRYEYLMEKHK